MCAVAVHDARPRMAVRIGVTGHRSFDDPAAPDRIFQSVRRAIADIRTAMESARAAAGAEASHADEKPLIQFLSPLAEGADRIAARAALAEGAVLSAAFPMPDADYEKDFPNTVEEFRELRAAAERSGGVTRLSMPEGLCGAERKEAYLQIGKHVLRHCDILIAVWDGKPPEETGGTAHVFALARDLGLPVVHIDALSGAMRVLGEESSPYTAVSIGGIVHRIMRRDAQG